MFGIFICFVIASAFKVYASIAGLTYRDNMDFAARYKDTTECDPMHWYPLHMPGYCVERLHRLMDPQLQELPYPPTIQLHFESQPMEKRVRETPSSYVMSLLRPGMKSAQMAVSGSNYGPVMVVKPKVSEKAARRILKFTGLSREIAKQRSKKRSSSRRRKYLKKLLKDIKKDESMLVQVD